MKKLLVTLILCLTCLVHTTFAAVTTISPGQSIAAAAATLTPGDTLYLHAGTYNQGIGYPNGTLPSGTGFGASQVITIAGYPGEVATVQHINLTGGEQYIIFDHLTVDTTGGSFGRAMSIDRYGTDGNGQTIPADVYVRFTNMDVTTKWDIDGMVIEIFANHLEFVNVTVHDTFHSSDPSHRMHCYYMIGSYNVVRDGVMHHCSGIGIQVWSSYPNISTHDNVISGNTIYGNGGSDNDGGIQMTHGANNIAYNNIVYANIGGSNGITVSDGCSNCAVYHNTISQNPGSCISVDGHLGTPNTQIKNNICASNGAAFTEYNSPSGTVYAGNVCSSAASGCATSGNLNFANVSAGDFRLQAGSVAIDAGVNLSSLAYLSTDKAGNSRPVGGWDAGAYEYGGVVIPPSTTYYVATNGNDSSSGDLAHPFLTINKGLSVVPSGGTLYIRGGVYTTIISDAVQTIASGTDWDHTTLISNYQGETVIIRPSGHVAALIVNQPGSHYIVFNGLFIDSVNGVKQPDLHDGNCFGYALSVGISGANHIRFQNGEIANSWCENVELSGTFNEVITSKIHTSAISYGFYVTGQDNLIDNNEIYNNGGYAVQIFHQTPADSHRHVVRNNKMYGNGYYASFGAITVGHGNDNKVYNNLIYDNFGGIDVNNQGNNNQFYNNTVYNNGWGFGFSTSVTLTNVGIKNNILVANRAHGTNFDTNGGTYATTSNLCDIAGPGCNIVGAANFVDVTVHNFMLQNTSMAIDNGVCLPEVPNDFANTARPVGVTCDIGAYEYGGTGPSVNEFYVNAATGVDIGRTCTQAGMATTPTLTIGKALSCVTVGGGKVHIAPGVYAENIDDVAQAIPGGTSWETATIIQATATRTVTLTSLPTGNITIFMHNAANSRYIIFDGLVLDGQSQSGSTGLVLYPGTDHIRFQNGEIHHYDTGVYWKQSNDSNLLDVKIHDILSGHGIIMGGSNGAFIRTSELYSIYGSAFEQIAGFTNSAFDFTRNIIHDIGTGGFYTAVVLAQGSDVLFANNLIYNCDAGVDVQGYNIAKVFNNTVYGCVGTGIKASVGASNVQIKNNIANGNLTNISDAVSSAQATNFTSDPLFVNAGSGNFQLQPTSAAIDVGTTLAEVPNDLVDVTRPQRSVYTIGAYEFVGVPGVPNPGDPITGVGVSRYGRQWAARGFFVR